MSFAESPDRVAAVVKRTERTLAVGATVASVGAAAVADVSVQRGWHGWVAAVVGALVLGGVGASYLRGPVRLLPRPATARSITFAVVCLALAALVLGWDAGWLTEWRFTAAVALATLPNWWLGATSSPRPNG